MKKEENILPENRHVWMQGSGRNPLHQATNVLCQPPEKVLRRMDEEDVTMRQDITATSGASRGPAMDIESRPSRKRVADVQTEDLEDNEQMDANESAAPLPQAEGKSSDGRIFVGNWEHDESGTHNQHLEDKVARDEYLGLVESMDITTVNEQGVQWDFTKQEMRNQEYKKIVAEKSSLLVGARPCASWRSKSNASWSRMTERKMTSCTEHEYTCSLFVACTSCSTRKVGTFCMNTVKVRCHGQKIASKKIRR